MRPTALWVMPTPRESLVNLLHDALFVPDSLQFVASQLPLFDPKQKRSWLDLEVLSGFRSGEPLGWREMFRC
jgi:hypothetical protein